jgi:hypothetical protein
MYRCPNSIAMLFLTTVAAALVGCGDSPTKQSASSQGAVTTGPPATVETGHDHAHPTEGPHGGSLIELGSEEYHAELVHDDAAKTVTIYLLDSAAKVSVPIDAAEIIINLKHDGKGEQFKVAASADTKDPAGKSSRFVSTDAELAEDLDHEDAEPQLAVKINGKQYRGVIKHDHEGHEHESHEHDGDETP